MNSRHSSNNSSSSHASRGLFATSASDRETLSEEAFHRMISIERRRTARSRKLFLLMLLDMGEPMAAKNHQPSLRKVMSTLSRMLRETDVTGWYSDDCVVGVLFTEITAEDGSAIVTTVMNRVSSALRSSLGSRQFNQVNASFHLFPEEQNERVLAMPSNPTLYSDPAMRDEAGRLAQR